MELYEEFKKYGIPEIRLTQKEWDDKYRTYSIYGLSAVGNNKQEKIDNLRMAAEDIIRIYLLEQKKKELEETHE